VRLLFRSVPEIDVVNLWDSEEEAEEKPEKLNESVITGVSDAVVDSLEEWGFENEIGDRDAVIESDRCRDVDDVKDMGSVLDSVVIVNVEETENDKSHDRLAVPVSENSSDTVDVSVFHDEHDCVEDCDRVLEVDCVVSMDALCENEEDVDDVIVVVPIDVSVLPPSTVRVDEMRAVELSVKADESESVTTIVGDTLGWYPRVDERLPSTLSDIETDFDCPFDVLDDIDLEKRSVVDFERVTKNDSVSV
jgi:hypothetical protein